MAEPDEVRDRFAGLARAGSFGDASEVPEPREVDYVVIDYYGVPVRVPLDPEGIALTFEEFMDSAAALEGPEDFRSVGLVRGFVRGLIHEEDFPAWWGEVKRRKHSVETQMEFAKYIVEAMTGHPFAEGSGSSLGPTPDQQNYAADSSLRVQHRLEQRGRPDLAMIVLQHREQTEKRGEPVPAGA